MTARRPLLVLLILLPVLASGAAPPDRQQLERGRKIYQEGTGPSGSPIVAVMGEGGVEVPAASLPCAGCHGRDGKGRPEGGVRPSDLTWTTLSKPYGVTHESGRRHPPTTSGRSSGRSRWGSIRRARSWTPPCPTTA